MDGYPLTYVRGLEETHRRVGGLICWEVRINGGCGVGRNPRTGSGANYSASLLARLFGVGGGNKVLLCDVVWW